MYVFRHRISHVLQRTYHNNLGVCLVTARTNKQPALHLRLFIGEQNKLNERDLQLQCDAMHTHLRSAGPSIGLANDPVQSPSHAKQGTV
jgi:hypothetical protein